MQYTSRIFIQFKNKESWESVLGEVKIGSADNCRSLLSFKDDPFAGYEYFQNGISVSEGGLNCELSAFFDERTALALTNSLVSVVGQKGIVFADTYSYGGDPVSYEWYYIGGEIHSTVRTRGADAHFHISISDWEKWLGTTRKKSLTAEEKAYLKECK